VFGLDFTSCPCDRFHLLKAIILNKEEMVS
jgi:hypothetical protein